MLLRGINAGGKNIISMKDLKQLLEQNGYMDVTTYINSGYIIFSINNSEYKSYKKTTANI